jgi:Fusaric acid resistance protein-like
MPSIRSAPHRAADPPRQRLATSSHRRIDAVVIRETHHLIVKPSQQRATVSRLRFVDQANTLLGGMWAGVATVFVFRETREGSVSAGVSRLIATCVSFALCFIYIALFSVNAAGIGLAIGLGTIVMMTLRRPDDVVTTGITTTVVLVAALDPKHALEQPPLRLLDTVVGVAVGVLLK